MQNDPEDHADVIEKVSWRRIIISFLLPGCLSNLQSSTTLGDVNDVRDLVAKFEYITLPDQVMLVIDNPLLQHHLALTSDDESKRARFERHLETFFNGQLDKIDSGQQTTDELSEVIGRLSSYTRYSKVNTNFKVFDTRIMLSVDTQIRKNLL